jgi:hypothetical protein
MVIMITVMMIIAIITVERVKGASSEAGEMGEVLFGSLSKCVAVSSERQVLFGRNRGQLLPEEKGRWRLRWDIFQTQEPSKIEEMESLMFFELEQKNTTLTSAPLARNHAEASPAQSLSPKSELSPKNELGFQ